MNASGAVRRDVLFAQSIPHYLTLKHIVSEHTGSGNTDSDQDPADIEYQEQILVEVLFPADSQKEREVANLLVDKS